MREVAFSVLGPVEVTIGGSAVPLGGGRQRALLVALVLDTGRVVSVERLVDELWGDLPPGSARTQVHTLVHRVRRALGEAGSLIETCPPGYVLRAGPARVDVTAFTELVARARDDVRRGHPDEAAAAFREALGLWRGRALDGANAAFVLREAARLEELRLAAYEECLGVELALGRHGAAAAELAALVAEHPLREELRALLMLALHRCGRRSEALESYRQGRALLVEETGLEPTERLRRVHDAVLRDDPALRAAEPDPPPTRPERPPPPAPAPPPAPRRTSSVRLRLAAAGVALTLAVSLSGSSVTDRHRAEAGTPDRQWVPGPAWVNDPPKPVPATFFGTSVGTNSGAMPGFRTGAVRFWDSRTRWANVEPRPGAFDWANLDRMVDGAEGARLPMLYTMGITPSWAAPDGPRSAYDDDSRTAPPRDLAHWDRYVRAVASRYKGRIGAYELWDYANTPHHYTGDLPTLAEMTRRASAIIRREDPRATVVCPSIGELWEAEGLRYIARFASLKGYRHCDAVAVKLHPRDPGGRPEEMTEQATLVYNALHDEGVHLPMWVTGPGHSGPTDASLGEEDANNFAVRFYLAGLYARYARMYFYSWGVRNLPLVLQVEGSPPTRAALFVEQLQEWLDGARIRSCGQGRVDGLPEGVRQCRFRLAGGEEGAVRWAIKGGAEMRLEHGAYRADHLDGRVAAVHGGVKLPLTERPVLVRFRAVRPADP
ncbi:BTAD domain-containing putative transcriptional regulator [Actinomadura rugatobispora]|uniref:BTAD domain-containing putative transcriptional regulator n=1 Tax=Actinomadura rugatobispora TaxID=1994 RepID=A0ABW0ZUF8_9ACTN|nr:hypothetical protein GCM10010200_023980 [Actinomadura rugatobispora]